jgi:hypothetical protein
MFVDDNGRWMETNGRWLWRLVIATTDDDCGDWRRLRWLATRRSVIAMADDYSG